MPESANFNDALVRRANARVDTSVCGRYRLGALIGVGGMAAVYAAAHRNGHAGAIQMVHDRVPIDPEINRGIAPALAPSGTQGKRNPAELCGKEPGGVPRGEEPPFHTGRLNRTRGPGGAGLGDRLGFSPLPPGGKR